MIDGDAADFYISATMMIRVSPLATIMRALLRLSRPCDYRRQREFQPPAQAEGRLLRLPMPLYLVAMSAYRAHAFQMRIF